MHQPSTHLLLWSLPQPIFVFSCTMLMATASITDWMDAELLLITLLLLPYPLLLLLERFTPRREDWLLDRYDLAEDAFWVLATLLIWIPIYEDYYDTPISDAFNALREASAFPYRFEADSVVGLLLVSLIAIFIIEFISYWAHRLQHRFMFLWRMHATHHHITKMSAARADRTHPLEFLALNLGSAVVLGFFGASAEVVATVLIFRVTTARVNHCNLPLTSGAFGWLFNTAEWHQLHHSGVYAESNTNFGCTVIMWDRIFGTFSDKRSVERVGNGTGRQLSLLTQLTLPFRSNGVIRSL